MLLRTAFFPNMRFDCSPEKSERLDCKWSFSCSLVAYVYQAALYLWVWELQASDGEDHLSCSHEEILRNLPSHVEGVRGNVQHLLKVWFALKQTNKQALRCVITIIRELIISKPCCDFESDHELPIFQMLKSAGWSRCKSCQISAVGWSYRKFLPHPWSWNFACRNKNSSSQNRGIFCTQGHETSREKHQPYFPCFAEM